MSNVHIDEHKCSRNLLKYNNIMCVDHGSSVAWELISMNWISKHQAVRTTTDIIYCPFCGFKLPRKL